MNKDEIIKKMSIYQFDSFKQSENICKALYLCDLKIVSFKCMIFVML